MDKAVVTTKFSIEKLNIIGDFGIVDIREIFEELNLFDTIFMPCVSGNILIRDATDLINKLSIDGKEYIDIKISKVAGYEGFTYEKKMKIQKIANRTNVNGTSQTYVIHFVADEFILSERTKVQQYYKATYSDIALKILKDYLNVDFAFPGIRLVMPTDGIHEIIVPNLSPLKAIDWIARRAIGRNLKPDYMFYQVPLGFNFVPLTFLLETESVFNITYGPKDTSQNSPIGEFLGARDVKVISQFSVLDSIDSGVYGGTFVGFDTITRTYRENIKTFDDLYGAYDSGHANKFPNVPNGISIVDGDIDKTYQKAKMTTYPFASPRTTEPYIRENNLNMATIVDNPHEYVFRRSHILNNLSQKRLQLTMPGNFGLFSGVAINLDIPKYQVIDGGTVLDDGLSGKYIVIATRHIIKYDRHETLIEISTDSTNKQR